VTKETKATLESESLDVIADRGDFNGEESPMAGFTVNLVPPR
jgi:hypothetical protein